MNRAGGLAAVGALLCLLAASFATPTLYVAGVALLALAGAAWAWVTLAARSAGVARAVGAETVEEGQEVSIVLNVRRGRLPFPGGELIPWQGSPPLSWVGARPSRLRMPATFPRRGRHVLEPARLRIADPLGIHFREVHSAAADLLVLPRVEAVRAPDAGGLPALSHSSGQGSTLAVALEVDSLRPHVPGAPASRIHWPTVARTGVLMEHRLVADAERRPLIVLDARHPASAEALDRALRAAASLCVHLARAGGCGVLLPGDRRATVIEPDLHGWPALHARLAVVEPGGPPPRGGQVERAALLLWVTGASGGPTGGLPRTSGARRFLVGPHPIAGPPVAFTVAGCSGQALRSGAGARAA